MLGLSLPQVKEWNLASRFISANILLIIVAIWYAIYLIWTDVVDHKAEAGHGGALERITGAEEVTEKLGVEFGKLMEVQNNNFMSTSIQIATSTKRADLRLDLTEKRGDLRALKTEQAQLLREIERMRSNGNTPPDGHYRTRDNLRIRISDLETEIEDLKADL